MKAIRIHEVGERDKIKIDEVPSPAIGDGQVRIKLAASGVNFIDIYQRSGLYPIELPYTLGMEGAGVITEVGSKVKGFKVGDRVAFSGTPGSYAEEIIAAPNAIVKVPEGAGLEEAAAVMLQGMTAHYLATSTFKLTPGKTCLVHAAAGGVGLLLTQIAKLQGAEVIGTVSTEEKAALAKEAGADHVILYTKSDFVAEVAKITNGAKLDVVYDSVGKTTFAGSLKCLKPRGMIVTFGQSSGPIGEINPLVLSQNGSLFMTRPTLKDYTSTVEDLNWRASDLFGWIAQKKLKVRIDRKYKLEEAAEAHRALEARETSGKVILIPG